MFELLIALGCLSMLIVPAMIAHGLSSRDEVLDAQNELNALELVGKRCDGTLYSLPGYVVIRPKRGSRPSAESRVA